MERCKRCGLKTTLSEEDIQKMVDEVKSMKGIRLIGKSESEKRLVLCYRCEDFMYGSTCSQCGCVMQVRTMLADGKCPKKKW